jgi:hypothetical protein
MINLMQVIILGGRKPDDSGAVLIRKIRSDFDEIEEEL